MPPKKDYCRNFQRGSCQYGDRCKFLHSTPQQSKPNPFGFGVQNGDPSQSNQQRQASNPFGFGVQNNSQTTGGNDFGSKSYHIKPFENKWTRSSSNSSNSLASNQANRQPPSANDHKCTDPEICKRIILEDLKNENPQWKLTCYGHKRDGPCDIVGDISCEELRALAYDDAKRGLSLSSIVERERNLVHSKLNEFQNLVKKPSDTNRIQSSFPGTSSNALNNSSGVSPSVSSFSQLNASLNTRAATTPNYTFGQATSFQTNSQTSSIFQTNKSSINNPGSFGSQFPNNQSLQSTFSSTPTSPWNTSTNNIYSTLSNSSRTTNVSEISMDVVNNVTATAPSIFQKSTLNVEHNNLKQDINVDNSIWNKPDWKWNVGEIPEEEPPANVIF